MSPSTSEAARLSNLQKATASRSGLDIVAVSSWRSGLDFWADLAESSDGCSYVVKSPKSPFVLSRYEGRLDLHRVLGKEVQVLGILGSFGLPVPRVLAAGEAPTGQGLIWALLERLDVVGDIAQMSPDTLRELGRILHDVHELPAALFETVDSLLPAQSESDLLRRAVDTARPYWSGAPTSVLLDRFCAAIAASRPECRRRLLHMDIRNGNVVLLRDGSVGLIDFSAALVLDRIMEFGRMRAYGTLHSLVREGYGSLEIDPGLECLLVDLYCLESWARRISLYAEEVEDSRLLAEATVRATEVSRRAERAAG